MKDLIKSNMFIAGFISGIFLFLCVNVYITIGICYHCVKYLGFPIVFYEDFRGIASEPILHRFFLSNLIADILAMFIFSFVLGLVFKFIWSKTVSRRSPLKELK